MVDRSKISVPFYDKKGVFTIYDDRMVLHKMGGQVIRFADVYKIIFNRLDFSLYVLRQNKYFTIVHMKNGDAFEIIIPLSGYYALKRFYETGRKTTGKFEISAFGALAFWALVILMAAFYYFFVYQ